MFSKLYKVDFVDQNISKFDPKANIHSFLSPYSFQDI